MLEVYWEKKDERSQAMRFGYEEPWIFGRPVFPGIRFGQEIRDTTYVEREWRAGLRASPWPAFSGSLEGVFKEILPDSVGSAVFGLAQTKSWMVSAMLDYSTLDEPLNPRQGVRYHTEVRFGRKQNLGPQSVLAAQRLKPSAAIRTVRADGEAALPVVGRQVFYAGVHGAEVRTGEDVVPLADQVRFGGANTLRGYVEDAFRGTLAAWMNLEYRYRIGRFSRAFVFFDAGMYQRKERRAEGTALVRGTKTGYGFGIRVETRLGLIGADYGLGEGDAWLRGKVHVRLVNRF
jgi:outer membrane protein assembly factor BamA